MPTDEQLYQDLCRGQVAAFDALYERYERRLFGFILSYVKNREEAEDVFHDAFQALFTAARGGEPAPVNFGSWLFTVARRLCLNRIRAKRPMQVVNTETAGEGSDAEVQLSQGQRQAALARAVEVLPPALGELYRLRAAGHSYEDIAGRLNVPLGTVKSRLNTLIRRLRKDMRQWLAR